MKRLLAFALAAAVFAVPAAQAGAAKAPTTAQLAKRITALEKQVKALQKKAKDTEDLAVSGLIVGFCLTAVTSDALQGTWQSVDQLAQAQGRPAIFGPQTPISDARACQAAQISRSQNVPPHTGGFAAITALVGAYRYSALNLLLG